MLADGQQDVVAPRVPDERGRRLHDAARQRRVRRLRDEEVGVGLDAHNHGFSYFPRVGAIVLFIT